MCLAVPGKLIAIAETTDPLCRQGTVDFSGIGKEVSLAYVPEAKIDDYILVHAGIALTVLDEDEAKASLEAFAELAFIEPET